MIKIKIKRSLKIEPKIKTSFVGVTGKDLMANPVFVDNATKCTVGAIRELLDKNK